MGNPVNVKQASQGQNVLSGRLSCNARLAECLNCKSCTVCNFVHYLHATHMICADCSKVFCVNGLQKMLGLSGDLARLVLYQEASSDAFAS